MLEPQTLSLLVDFFPRARRCSHNRKEWYQQWVESSVSRHELSNWPKSHYTN